jgi:SAM-dependent methyltransferase
MESNNLKDKHLDLGCGQKPKNPYKSKILYGIDVEKIKLSKLDRENILEIKQANLIFDPIPFEDSFFDSVSAYDFIEHIPRITSYQTGGKNLTKYSFIDLMNEIHRVLRHQGKFYASTPVYPDASVFIDPTHVNYITDKTHYYFCLPSLGASMYGFKGKFRVIRVIKIRPKYLYEPQQLTLKERLRKINDKFRKLESHLIWELEAIKY